MLAIKTRKCIHFSIYKICFVLCYNNDADTNSAVIKEKQSIYETIYGKYILMLNTITRLRSCTKRNNTCHLGIGSNFSLLDIS